MQRISMSRKTITLLDHRRQSIIQERNQRRSQLVNLPAAANFHTSVDHTYNTIQWTDNNSSTTTTSTSSDRRPSAPTGAAGRRKPFGSAVAPMDADEQREGADNRGFEASTYDDLLERRAEVVVTRARPSRVTFS